MKSDLFIAAGEASADIHGARVLEHLKQGRSDLSIFGIGGEAVGRQGAELVVSASELSLFGITNLIGRAPEIWKSYRKLVSEIERRSPRCALLIDMPDLNLKLARHLKARGTRVFYYISPQVWAWRGYRVKKIQRLVDKMMVVFPFEQDFYRARGVEAEFVGHPLIESIAARKAYRSQGEISAAPRIALLPGSRPSELRHHLGKLNETVSILRRHFPKAEFRLPIPPTLPTQEVKDRLVQPVLAQAGGALEILAWADIALIASGTATLEAALVGTPSTLFYEVSSLNAWVYKNFVRYQGYMGMPNVLLKEEAIREWFQDEATVDNLVGEARRLIEDEKYRARVTQRLTHCRRLLGGAGASQKVAENILAHL